MLPKPFSGEVLVHQDILIGDPIDLFEHMHDPLNRILLRKGVMQIFTMEEI